MDSLPDRAASLVYTSGTKLRSRVQALRTQVVGSGTLLRQIATVRATVRDAMEPIDTGHTLNFADSDRNDHGANGELPTISITRASNPERL